MDRILFAPFYLTGDDIQGLVPGDDNVLADSPFSVFFLRRGPNQPFKWVSYSIGRVNTFFIAQAVRRR